MKANSDQEVDVLTIQLSGAPVEEGDEDIIKGVTSCNMT